MHVFVCSALWKIAELPKPVPAVGLAERAHQSPVGRDSGDPHRADGSSSASGGTLQHPQHFPQETVASAPLSAPPQHARPHNDLGKVNTRMLQFQPFVCVFSVFTTFKYVRQGPQKLSLNNTRLIYQ